MTKLNTRVPAAAFVVGSGGVKGTQVLVSKAEPHCPHFSTMQVHTMPQALYRVVEPEDR